jgi:group I intron endonuclease
MDYTIYILQNKVNLKIYVGQTNNPRERFWRHKYLAKTGNKRHLYQAIRKYGADAFSFTELETVSEQEVDEAETFWIQFFRSQDRNYGYNLDSGGNPQKKRSPETIARIVESLKTTHPWKGKAHSEETKQLMSESGKKRFESGEISSLNGQTHRRKLTEDQVKEILQLLEAGVSQYKIAKQFNVSRSNVYMIKAGKSWQFLQKQV